VGEVTDGDLVAERRRPQRCGVEHRTVLDRAPFPDDDLAVVGPEHRSGPHRDSEPRVTDPITTASGWT
jgi:hypothetical protein